jgi:hypothetical protein
VRRAVGSWGGQRPRLAPYLTGTGPKDGATAAAFMLPILSTLHASWRPRARPPYSCFRGQTRTLQRSTLSHYDACS